MLSPPKPLDWGPGEGSKGQISLKFNYKVSFFNGGQKFNFSEHGHVAYKIEGDDE